MLRNFFFTRFLFILIIFLPIVSTADSRQQSPREVISSSVEKLVPLVAQARPFFSENPEALYSSVAELLTTIFDFDGFARGVMGPIYAAATAAQRTQFSVVLKRSLVITFTDGLISLGEFSITISEAKISKPSRAKVSLRVMTAEKASHDLSYSLALSPDGLWRVRNVVFDGVNLGLTFRNQFANAVTTEGSIEDAINRWNITVDDT